jgi:hypothetical protein
MTADDDDEGRRTQELESLQAFYGDDICVCGDDDNSWTVKIAPGIDLEFSLPRHYPSRVAPTPTIRAPSFVLDAGRKKELETELVEMYQESTEVAILWTEYLKAMFQDREDQLGELPLDLEENPPQSVDGVSCDGKSRTFQPYNSRFGQPTRHFDANVIDDESNRRDIHRGQPFHPPKSGPAEVMIAHVASVESMDHVNWVLAQLLFHDKKVAKANHNMIAYRFWDKDRNCLVSDNDDDGEKGAGSKLALLLDMADTQNVMVVVSRWFGGIHLGSSRFKHFASVARDALKEAGFIKEKI